MIDPSVWPDLMEGISSGVGATGAILLQSDSRTPDVPHTSGVHDLRSAYFGEGWHTKDPRAERAVPLLVGGIRSSWMPIFWGLMISHAIHSTGNVWRLTVSPGLLSLGLVLAVLIGV